MGHCKSSTNGKVHSNIGLPQETRKKSIKKANSTPEATRKGEMKNPRVSRRKKILKIRAEINAKETIAKINKAKSWFFEKINKIGKPDSSRNKGRRIKSTKLEMKMERSQQTTQTYKGS